MEQYKNNLTLSNPLLDDSSARVPLLAAASSGQLGLTQQLLQYRGSAGALKDQDMDGHTALHLAALHGNAAMVQMLLESAATEGAAMPASLVCMVDHAGNTPLHLAALKGHYAVAEQLLAAPDGCAAIDIADNNGMSSFYIAAMHGHYTVAALVLQRSLLHSPATASSPASSALAAMPACRKTKLLKLLGRCEQPTLLGLLSWQAGSCAAVRLRDPQATQAGPMVNLSAQFMALGHYTGGSVKQSDLGQPALDLLQQQVQMSMGLTLCKDDQKDGNSQGDTLQMLLRTGITCKVLDVANGEHGFGHFPYEVEVTMEPCLEHLKDSNGSMISTPAVSSSASPFDQTMMSTVAVGAAVQAGRVPFCTPPIPSQLFSLPSCLPFSLPFSLSSLLSSEGN